MPPKSAAVKVIQRLRQSGFEALLAGGCVRDLLLGKKPKDYDVATNARPEQVTTLFRRTLTVGAQFGVVVVLLGGRQIEVATYRSDMDYPDGRRPQAVVFTDARQDAQRRDFTINGMFFDPLKKKVIDYVGGQRDLKQKIIQAIGNAEQRFAEDHLRMLRAIRFAGRLQFAIAPATWKAIRKNAPKIQRISAERIATELEMIVTDPNRSQALQLTRQSGLLERIFPDVPPQQVSLGIRVVSQLPRTCSFTLALSAFLSGGDERSAGKICRQLKTSNELRKQVQWLLGNRRFLLDAIPMSKGPLKTWLAQPLFETLVRLIRCDLRAAGQSEGKLLALRRQIAALGDESITPPRLLDGHELIRLGATPGPMVGRLAEELYLAQLETVVQKKSEARSWVRQWLVKNSE
jgi:poly(A) polymerase